MKLTQPLFGRASDRAGEQIMMRRAKAIVSAPVVFLALTTANFASSQDVAEFYRRKTPSMAIGYPAGGGFDSSARLLLRHMSRHVPGHRTIIPKNMPGAGRLVATDYLFSVAPRDGTEFGMVGGSIAFGPLWSRDGLRFEATKFNWLGSMDRWVGIALMWPDNLDRRGTGIQSDPCPCFRDQTPGARPGSQGSTSSGLGQRTMSLENRTVAFEARSAAPVFPREIVPDVFWFASCNEVETPESVRHNHNSCFLIKGQLKTVLIDTAAPRGWPALKRQLASALGGRPLDYLFPTHPEMPHMGNLGPLMETYPEACLIGDTRNYHLFFPELEPRFRPMAAGKEVDLGGRRLRLIAPVIYDLPNTLWAYEPEAEILFVSDAYPFCHDHLEGECAMMSTELSHPYRSADTDRVLSGALGWTRFVDAEFTIGNLDEFLRAYPARLIAPAHGGVIQAPDEVTELFKEGLRNVRCT